jgi:hypothetical protein
MAMNVGAEVHAALEAAFESRLVGSSMALSVRSARLTR